MVSPLKIETSVGIQAFTDFGIENLIELIRFYKENPGLLRR